MTASNPTSSTSPADHALVIDRVLKAPRAALWRAWSEPALLAQWWCPKPWTTEVKAFDLRAGGAFHTFMSGPDGGTSDNPGVFLEVDPATRWAFTTVLSAGWRPVAAWLPMTAVLQMSDAAGGGTRYVATVLHPDEATKQRHAELGFDAGWNACIDQLDALALTLR